MNINYLGWIISDIKQKGMVYLLIIADRPTRNNSLDCPYNKNQVAFAKIIKIKTWVLIKVLTLQEIFGPVTGSSILQTLYGKRKLDMNPNKRSLRGSKNPHKWALKGIWWIGQVLFQYNLSIIFQYNFFWHDARRVPCQVSNSLLLLKKLAADCFQKEYQ